MLMLTSPEGNSVGCSAKHRGVCVCMMGSDTPISHPENGEVLGQGTLEQAGGCRDLRGEDIWEGLCRSSLPGSRTFWKPSYKQGSGKDGDWGTSSSLGGALTCRGNSR